MKRIFLYFSVARESQVERPGTPVVCCLAHERQKGSHHVHKHSQVPRAPVSNTSYPLHRQDGIRITVREMDAMEYKQHIYRQQNQIVSIQHVTTSWSLLSQDMEEA